MENWENNMDKLNEISTIVGILGDISDDDVYYL